MSPLGQPCPSCSSPVGQSVDIECLYLPPEIVNIISGALARHDCILPVSQTSFELTLATCYPHTQSQLIEKLRFVLNTKIKLLYSDREILERAIERYLPDASEPEIWIC
ncbi:hypothetical protein [Rubripirellula obstinata]